MERFKRKINYALRIENAFVFLQNNYKDINPIWFSDIDLSLVKTIEDVYAITLCKVANVIAKRGLYKEYISVKDVELVSPKGRIEVNKSVSKQTMSQGKLVCTYDELSDNVQHNKILKSVLFSLIHNKNLSKDFTFMMQKSLNDFNGIEIIDIKSINWKRIRFNNSNIRYKTALDLCRTIIQMENMEMFEHYEFDDKLYTMFCKSLYNYYDREYKDRYYIDKLIESGWTSKYRFEKIVDKNRHYPVIVDEDIAIVVGFEKYDSYNSSQEEDAQMKYLASLCNEYSERKNIKVYGALFYVNATDGYKDKEIQIVNVDGVVVGYTVIDCNIKFMYIKYKLNQLVDTLIKRK